MQALRLVWLPRCQALHKWKYKKITLYKPAGRSSAGFSCVPYGFYVPGIIRAVYVHQGRQNIQHQHRIQKPNQPNARPDAGRSAQTGNHRRIAHECDTDARRQDAEGDEVRQRVDLDAELALQLRPVLLAAGKAGVECVKQAAQQQKQRPQHRMPRPTQGDKDSRYK